MSEKIHINRCFQCNCIVSDGAVLRSFCPHCNDVSSFYSEYKDIPLSEIEEPEVNNPNQIKLFNDEPTERNPNEAQSAADDNR